MFLVTFGGFNRGFCWHCIFGWKWFSVGVYLGLRALCHQAAWDGGGLAQSRLMLDRIQSMVALRFKQLTGERSCGPAEHPASQVRRDYQPALTYPSHGQVTRDVDDDPSGDPMGFKLHDPPKRRRVTTRPAWAE